ncbi:helix-turn-helix transcriptional regulator [Dactylosporangium sp. NPDC049742]|uniref:PadR family transcriptional regulator n=1 Tax=Dactylosporangium sp. NPDC049742 TaxID=3154737 RepID=UPI003439BC5F
MQRVRRPSPQTAAVLRALAVDPAQWRYGYELGQEVGLKAGSLYPILIRLSDRGLLEASWETDPPHGRPPRHLYRLTGAGVTAAADLEPLAAPAPPARPARTELRAAW